MLRRRLPSPSCSQSVKESSCLAFAYMGPEFKPDFWGRHPVQRRSLLFQFRNPCHRPFSKPLLQPGFGSIKRSTPYSETRSPTILLWVRSIGNGKILASISLKKIKRHSCRFMNFTFQKVIIPVDLGTVVGPVSNFLNCHLYHPVPFLFWPSIYLLQNFHYLGSIKINI